jgi:hypothetical protein
MECKKHTKTPSKALNREDQKSQRKEESEKLIE